MQHIHKEANGVNSFSDMENYKDRRTRICMKVLPIINFSWFVFGIGQDRADGGFDNSFNVIDGEFFAGVLEIHSSSE